MPNINNKQWIKKFSEDKGYGSDESLTMQDTGDYTQTQRAGGQSLAGQGRGSMSTRSGGRQPIKPSPPPRIPPPRRP